MKISVLMFWIKWKRADLNTLFLTYLVSDGSCIKSNITPHSKSLDSNLVVILNQCYTNGLKLTVSDVVNYVLV